jgi:hypothetical protein
MNSEHEAAERAEFIQSVKALLIPVALFLAGVIMAAGTFLIYNSEPVGWMFCAVSVFMIIGSIVALIQFQNTYRARGILKHGLAAETIENDELSPAEIDDPNIVDFRPLSDDESDTTISQHDRLAEHHSG